jgi:hypothetical protein
MISNIANAAAYAAIVQAVNASHAAYTKDNASYEMFAEDNAYIAKVLAQFAEDRNVDALIQNIAEQDTYVRDYYAYIVNDLHSDYYNGEWQ